MESQTERSFELTNLAERPDLRSAYLLMIEKVFPKGSPLSRKLDPEDEFKLLLDPKNASRNLMLIDSKAAKDFSTWPICAISSYRIFDVHVSGEKRPLRFAGVGLVCTHPNFRKLGLGHRIQATAEAHAKNEKALLSVLWSDLVTYYTGLGYLVAGNEAQWQLDKSEIVILSERIRREYNKTLFDIEKLTSFDRVQESYKAAGVGPERDAELYSELLKLPNTYAYAATSKNSGKALGYAVMGKARDLRDTIHEILGPKDCVAPLLAKLLTHCESGLRLYHPPTSPLIPELEHWLGPANNRAMAFFKVLDGSALIQWMNTSRLLPTGISLQEYGTGFSLSRMHVTFFESPDPGHLVQLFFGPWSISELEDLPKGLRDEMGSFRALLPIYFWGLDSV